jgi:hypothetical protein
MYLDDYGLEYQIGGWNRYLSIFAESSRFKRRDIFDLMPSQKTGPISVYLSILWHGKSVIALAPFKIDVGTAQLTVNKAVWQKLTDVARATILQDFKITKSYNQYEYLELDLCT